MTNHKTEGQMGGEYWCEREGRGWGSEALLYTYLAFLDLDQ